MTQSYMHAPSALSLSARQRSRGNLLTGLKLLGWAAGLGLLAALCIAFMAGAQVVSVKLALAVVVDAVAAAGALVFGIGHLALGAVRWGLARRTGR